MPSVSKAQQRFMGLVHAYKKGEVPASKVSKAVKDAAKSMKKKSTKDFASTKHDDLPDKVREYLMSENPAASAAAAMAMMQLQNPDTGKKVSAITPLRNKDHKLHKKSKGIFQRLKDKFMKKNESVNEDVFAIVDKYNDRKQDYDQVYFKDNNLNKVKKHMKKMGKKYGKMNLIRVKPNGKMSVVENLKEDGHTDVASAERKLKLIMKDAMDTLNALRNLSNEDSLPSWWTDKITLAKDYVGKSRDYIMNPAEGVDEGFGGELTSKDKKKFEKARKENAEQLGYELTGTSDVKESVNEDITSAGYYFLRKAAYSIGIALRDLNNGIKRQKDKIVLNEIDYIYDKATEMKKMMKNKRYNESVNEKVIKVSKKDDIPGNPMKMKGEEKIKKLTYSGSVGMDKPGSYEIKGNKLNVNNIRPRDKGFFVRHFTMGTGFRKANLYYDGVHWQGGKKF